MFLAKQLLRSFLELKAIGSSTGLRRDALGVFPGPFWVTLGQQQQREPRLPSADSTVRLGGFRGRRGFGALATARAPERAEGVTSLDPCVTKLVQEIGILLLLLLLQ